MENYCVNKLIIQGNELDIISFLNDLKNDDNVFSMSTLMPRTYYVTSNEAWNILYWGTESDLINCDDYDKVIKNCKNNAILNYLTISLPNIIFIENIAKKYCNLKFSISFLQLNDLFSGEKVFINGKLKEDMSSFYKENLKEVLDFAINKKLISLRYVVDMLNKYPNTIFDYFFEKLKKEDQKLILDFNEIKENYLIEKIKLPE